MFIENKYSKIYYLIVNRSKLEKRTKSKNVYYESHHIVPKSLGGSNDNDNKVLLTFKEHYICHRLLPKMLADKKDSNKMKYALYMLCKSNDYQTRSITRHQLMKCMEANREASKNRDHKPNLGNKHSEKTKQILRESATGKTHTEEAKQKIRENNVKTNASRGAKTKKALTGKTKSIEHKRKISEAIKRKHAERKLVAEVGIEPTTPSV